uniref:NADH-ubiquinone oxidoreductase chain 5 n=1 Tax=Haemaphysalis colasbelcouri TaxID=2926932 RepID=A0A976R6B6_9ACAR|nr:NADH dehydrogenase subunit 5 [Haemaphysalis colasbelcouri]UNO54009.1 NADH dehydrogenase subunit 5 [Haemaphysalis colasbelcouri]
MFIKWSILLLIMSFFYFYLFLFTFFFKNVFVFEYYITSVTSMDFKFYFLFDWISNLFISVVLFISSMVILYSNSYMNADKNKNSFCLIVLLFVFSMILLIMMPNMFMLILGWDGLGLVSYCLVIFYQSTNSYNSGMMTIISNRVGDVLIIMSLIFFFNFGSFDIISNTSLEMICGIFLILAGMTKSAQIPFSAWLPAAMAAPTPVSSLVHSSTLVTAGVYILIRFNYLFSINEYSMFLLKISLLTMFMSGINAFFETDLKKIIAFSTLSQLSMMMIVLSLGMMEMAFFHLIMHAIFKSMLFLCAGLIIHSLNGIQDIRMLGNFFSYSPIVISCMLISILSLMGFPFIGGFYSKDLIVEFFFFKIENLLLIVIFLMSIMFTFLYSIRLFYLIGLKSIFNVPFSSMKLEKNMIFPIYFLTLSLLLMGNFFSWSILINVKIMFISSFSKAFSLILMSISIYISWVIFGNKMVFINAKNIDFFYKMWFMSNLTSMIFLYKNTLLLKVSISDWKWMEMIGPTGLKTNLTQVSLFLMWLNNNFFSKILLSILILIVFIY